MCIRDSRYAKVSKGARNDKALAKEADLVKRIIAHLEDGKMARSLEIDDEEEQALLQSFNLLTGKPVIYAANAVSYTHLEIGHLNHNRNDLDQIDQSKNDDK